MRTCLENSEAEADAEKEPILGLVTSYTLGGLIHLLLVIAIVVVLLRVIQGRKPF